MMVCTDRGEWPVMAQISAMVQPAGATQVTAVSRRSDRSRFLRQARAARRRRKNCV